MKDLAGKKGTFTYGCDHGVGDEYAAGVLIFTDSDGIKYIMWQDSVKPPPPSLEEAYGLLKINILNWNNE